jgi:catechol 2,3-dioxygenase-like lactoylglutathione lyase family enzyme
LSSSVHVSLNVSNLSRSVDFYRRFLGEPRKLEADYAKFVGEEPEIHLALQPADIRGSGALSHLGIRVDSTEVVERWRRVLASRGLPTEEEKREACCYALQEKFWVSDPDGNRWEVYTVLEDLDRKSDAATSCCRPTASAPGTEGADKASLPAACC